MGKGRRKKDQKKKNGYAQLERENNNNPTSTTNPKNRKLLKGGNKKKKPNSILSSLLASDTSFRNNVVGSDGSRQIIDVAADGNCLFRAISDQIYRDYGQRHEQVREEICNFLNDNKEDFAIFLLMDDDEEDVRDFDEYVEEMREDGIWGGDVEIACAARLYRCPIIIYSANGAYNIGTGSEDNEATNGSDILLSYHENSHYNSVRDESKPRPIIATRDTTTSTSYSQTITESTQEEISTRTTTTTTTSTGDNIRSKKRNRQKQQQQQKNQHEEKSITSTQTQEETKPHVPIENESYKSNETSSTQQDTIPKEKEASKQKKQIKRNDTCHCGSGLKYKKCCMTIDKSRARTAKFKAERALSDDDKTLDEDDYEGSSSSRGMKQVENGFTILKI